MSHDESVRDEPTINIRGQRVGLGPLEPDLAPLLTRWINVFETSRTIGVEPRPMTLAQERTWVERMTTNDSHVIFAIYDLTDMKPVGSTNLMDIDYRHRSCELGIGIMEPDRRGKGLGTEAVQLITDYAIHGLDCITCSFAPTNTIGPGIERIPRPDLRNTVVVARHAATMASGGTSSTWMSLRQSGRARSWRS